MRQHETADPFAMKITRLSFEQAQSLTFHPKNPKIHPRTQIAALDEAMRSFGIVGAVLVNDANGYVLDGHARIKTAVEAGQTTVPVLHCSLTDAEEDALFYSFDRVGQMYVHDRDLYAQLEAQIAAINPELIEALRETDTKIVDGGDVSGGASDPHAEGANPYTTATPSPIYTPTGERPPVAALLDTTRRDALLEAIAATSLPDEARAFLVAAASRHVVFNYRAIAEFYAHADSATQRLMEDSALVIIDFNRAIELGYVRLSSRLTDLLAEEHGGDDDD